MGMRVESARGSDLGPALALLSRVGLPTEGVAERFGHYFVVREDTELVGLCGLSVLGTHALLRCVAVDPALQGEGLGTQLVRAAEALARRMGVGVLHLVAASAQGFFARLGYEDVSRDEVPGPVRDSWEFRTSQAGTPVMRKVLGKPGR